MYSFRFFNLNFLHSNLSFFGHLQGRHRVPALQFTELSPNGCKINRCNSNLNLLKVVKWNLPVKTFSTLVWVFRPPKIYQIICKKEKKTYHRHSWYLLSYFFDKVSQILNNFHPLKKLMRVVSLLMNKISDCPLIGYFITQ